MPTTLVWDNVGSKTYESGVDRGVLFPPEGSGVAWNGLIGVSERLSNNENTPVFFDGTKFAESIVPGDFAGTIRAYTYPDEMLECEGTVEVENGLFVGNQYPGKFGMSYRTGIDNDDGSIDAYKIHVLYNLTAVPSAKNYQTIGANVDPMIFEWSVTAIPSEIPGYRSTAHLIFDTRYMNEDFIQDIENALYGDGVTEPSLPPPSTLVGFADNWVIMRITDNGDGTWTADGPDNLILMIDSTTFQIVNANAKYLDDDTYMISDLTHQ